MGLLRDSPNSKTKKPPNLFFLSFSHLSSSLDLKVASKTMQPPMVTRYHRRIRRAKLRARSGMISGLRFEPCHPCSNASDPQAYELLLCLLDGYSELDIFQWDKHQFADQDFAIPESYDTLPRINYDQVSREEFIRQFEEKSIPVVIRGVTQDWEACKNWNSEVQILAGEILLLLHIWTCINNEDCPLNQLDVLEKVLFATIQGRRG